MFQSDDAVSTLEDFGLAGIPGVTPESYCGKIKNPTIEYFDIRETMGMIFEISTKNIEAMTTLDFDTLFAKSGN